jgi:hypothetical protein
MKTIFLEKIGFIKKVALLAPYLKKNELKNQIEKDNLIKEIRLIVNKLNVQNFRDTANELYPGFTDMLKQHWCELSDREIDICCLILFDFNNDELDLFLNDRLQGSKNSIQAWKTAIRRKLGIKEYGDIKKYLLTSFEATKSI